MRTTPIFQKLRSKLRAFAAESRGNVVVTFAFASLPVVGFVGAAVDYTNANQARTAMQMALDSTALMLSKEASAVTSAQMNTKAKAYFDALYTRKDVTGITVTPSYTTTSGSQVKVDGSGVVKTSFMGIMGFSQMTIRGTSTVAWGNARVRVALALDNTGSMAEDGKMTALKVAAKSLLSQLKAAANKNGDVYVSIIPFSKDVNVGKSNYTQNWVYWGDYPSWDGWDSENGDDVSTTTCTSSKGKKKKCTTSSSWVPDNHNTWNGCVTDRELDYDILNTSPSTSIVKTLFPAEQYDDCPTQMMGLTYDWVALNAKIDAMYPAGATNQPIGLAWAWQSLTASPFTIPPKDSNYTYSDVIILMTDGLNTESRHTDQMPWWDTNGKKTVIDVRQRKLCDNIKAAKVTVYTIFVNTGGDPSQDVLKNCATDASKAFEIKNANETLTVFNQIGTQLSQLRISN
jgi:Flp pilus assembly protein TadG